MTEAAEKGGVNGPDAFILKRNGWMPNNPRLPVILYRDILEGSQSPDAYEEMLTRNGWPARWRNGVFDYHHYHSTAHEVLVFARGHARLMLGGPLAREVRVAAGDAAVLPVGTGHCRLEASADFLVIGAYPPGQDWDLCSGAPSPEMEADMRDVPFPDSDPVSGPGGPLVSLWKGG